MGIAQPMEPPNWKAEVQYLGGFESPVWQGIFLRDAVFSAYSLKASVQPPFTLACLNICVHIKNPKHLQPYGCLDEQVYTAYTYSNGQLLLCLLCLTQERRPELSANDSDE